MVRESRRPICRTCSSGSIEVTRRRRVRRAPAWACGSPGDCWRSNAAGSGRKTVPTAARSSPSPCPRRGSDLNQSTRHPHDATRSAFSWSTMRSRFSARSDRCCVRAATTSISPSTGADALRMVSRAAARISSCSIWGCRIWKAPRSVVASGWTPKCRSSCSQREVLKPTRSARSISGPTTTSPSRLVRKSCWRGFASRCAG